MLKNIAKTLAIGLCAAALMTALPFQATAKPKNLSKSVKVGDTVYFGKYEQDGNTKNGKEKIEWQVLDKKGGKALLISKKVLDVQPYNEQYIPITWEECTLRTWLNKDFMKAAFSSKESKKVQKSKIENKEKSVYGYEDGLRTVVGKNTTDQVFLLNIDEAKRYFKTDKKRIAEITNYGIKRVAKIERRPEKEVKAEYFNERKNCDYWLRSPGTYQDTAAYVINDGSVNEYGGDIPSDVGVRPAIWVGP